MVLWGSLDWDQDVDRMAGTDDCDGKVAVLKGACIAGTESLILAGSAIS
jgi:hypothetical protein